jgi:5-methylcytosine-specific restriction enzyme subunit McrC
MLLHPQVGGSVDEYMELQGHKMRFRTIDLTSSPPSFEESLCGLVA